MVSIEVQHAVDSNRDLQIGKNYTENYYSFIFNRSRWVLLFLALLLLQVASITRLNDNSLFCVLTNLDLTTFR